jgi:hypothetical protein
LHAAGTEPPGTSLNRAQRLTSPTFHTPFWYTAVPVWPDSSDVPLAVRLYVTVAEVAEFTVTPVTLAPSPLARGKLRKELMAPENVLPFCTRPIFCESGVLELKNFSQFVLISAAAAAVLVAAGADEDAGADVAGADVAGVAELELEEELELLQAVSAAASARASAGAKIIRRGGTVNPMTRLLSLGRRYW